MKKKENNYAFIDSQNLNLGTEHGVEDGLEAILRVSQRKISSFNHLSFHFILEQISEKGIEKLMQRVGMGYAKYFNNKYKRSDSLFQGTFKAIHIDTNEYLLHLSAYINLNHKVHELGHLVSKLHPINIDLSR